MKDILLHLFAHRYLSRQEAYNIMQNIGQGAYNESEKAAFLAVFLMRNISVDELQGFKKALLDLCVKIDMGGMETIDLCGTGGDGKDTFNISTLSSFVVAGTGAKVVKHGNNGVSSICGSSNMLEFYGYKFTNDADVLKRQIEKAGICYLHAPMFHPALKNIAPTRRQLGVKTFFNILGPMVNPCFPTHQMIGVYSLELARVYNYLYQQTDKKYSIIHSLDVYDEISLTSDFKVYGNEREEIISPKQLGLPTLQQKDIYGGESIEESAQIFMNVLENKATTAQKSVVIANAAFAIQTLKPHQSNLDCVAEARESLDSGKALKAFKTLIELQ